MTDIRFDYIEVGFYKPTDGPGKTTVQLTGRPEEAALLRAIYDLWKKQVDEERAARLAAGDEANPIIVGSADAPTSDNVG